MISRLPSLAALFGAAFAIAQDPTPTIADKTKGLESRPGLFETFIDGKQGKALVKFPPADAKGRMGQFLYVESLATGLGANDVGLDRTQFGRNYVIDVRLVGNKVLFEAPNLNYRADSPIADEQRAVREGFATSIIWAGAVLAQDKDGSVLTDITDLVVRDAHTSAEQLGSGYSLDKTRSALHLEGCKAFPDNLEFEALLTFSAAKANPAIGDHAPEPMAVTLTQRHSFVRLPAPGYKPRRWDPRSGVFGMSYLDFAAPLTEPLIKLFIARHRLEKTDPSAARSTVKEPIVYYVDRGVPEPVRTALIEGGNYWKRAFDEAGFIEAFRVELMPEGLDPLDARYNVIQWMNRSTRGWAYGQSVVDPRTGEIIKGAVNLDSQRARQDILLFESLVGVDATGKGGPNDPMRAALSRIRQLSAHEIGHTLGFRHNFAASTMGRASVMDYPAPLIKLSPTGTLDLSDAYAQGIGEWDVQLVRFAYTEFAAGQDEMAALNGMIEDGIQKGLVLLTDEDTPEGSGANPRTSRWDNGKDPIEGLHHALRVREAGIRSFGERNLRKGQPMANLEVAFGPLYFFHRYDVDTVVRMIGGVHYTHRLNGDPQAPPKPVSAARQRAALKALMACLEPATLEVPPGVAQLLGPWAPDLPSSRERFPRNAPFVFDTVAAAASAGDLVFAGLLNPARCARVVELSSRDASLPKLEEVLSSIASAVAAPPSGAANRREIAWALQHALVARVMDLAASASAGPGVRARASSALKQMMVRYEAQQAADSTGHAAALAREIRRFLTRPLQDAVRPASPLPALPGSPIGACGQP